MAGDWKELYSQKMVSIDQAAMLVESGDRIFACGAGNLPQSLIAAVCAREDLRDIQIITATNGVDCAALTDSSCFDRVEYHTMFAASADRRNHEFGNVHYNSVQLSHSIDALRHVYHVNTFMLQVTLPDEDGYMYFGTRGVPWGSIIDFADKCILVVNAYQQKVNGVYNRIHISKATAICHLDTPLPKYQFKPIDEISERIAGHILPLIKDGSTLQVGIGGIPNAVAYGLCGRKHLGIYTEILTEAQLHMMESGAVDLDRVKASYVVDGRGYVDENLLHHIRFAPLDIMNDVKNIAMQPNMVSVNACLMADVTGQICSEAIGTRQYSGVGGQLDYIRGAAASPDGQSFICLKSTHTNKDGSVSSSISTLLPEGAVVTTPRTDVMYVVTEWGIANLLHRPIEDRICAMINIAHPDYRHELTRQAIDHKILRPKKADQEIIFVD